MPWLSLAGWDWWPWTWKGIDTLTESVSNFGLLGESGVMSLTLVYDGDIDTTLVSETLTAVSISGGHDKCFGAEPRRHPSDSYFCWGGHLELILATFLLPSTASSPVWPTKVVSALREEKLPGSLAFTSLTSEDLSSVPKEAQLWFGGANWW